MDLVLLSPRDAGERLGLTSSGVRRLSEIGELPTVRDSSGRRLYRPEDVERVVAARAKKRKRVA